MSCGVKVVSEQSYNNGQRMARMSRIGACYRLAIFCYHILLMVGILTLCTYAFISVIHLCFLKILIAPGRLILFIMFIGKQT